jgi:agmatinase
MAHLFVIVCMAGLSIAHGSILGHSLQQPMAQPPNFISNSIFRSQPNLLESIAEPE